MELIKLDYEILLLFLQLTKLDGYWPKYYLNNLIIGFSVISISQKSYRISIDIEYE